MNGEEAFHAALREDPSDELTWRALADWLDDVGQGDRAELLRLTLRLLATPLARRGRGGERAAALVRAGVKPVSVTWTNSVGMRFVLVLPGRFLMGSPEDEKGRRSNETQHEVAITRAFWIGIHPVTQGQYRAVMGSNPSHFSRKGNGKGRVKAVSAADLKQFPVEDAPWEDVNAFLTKLAALEDEAALGRRYRLPTEAEWEYSCRGGHTIHDAGDGHTLPFHFDRPTSSLSPELANVGDGLGELDRTSKVGSYPANALGIHDMHGNVYERCSDWYAEGYYAVSPRRDPAGPGGGSSRVVRGGCWGNSAVLCRAAYRFGDAMSAWMGGLGFRVVSVPRA